MGIVCRGAMHGFAALPSAIMGGSLRADGRAAKPCIAPLQTQHPYPILARFSNFRKSGPDRAWV